MVLNREFCHQSSISKCKMSQCNIIMTVRISKTSLRTLSDPEIQGPQSWPGLLTGEMGEN